MLAFTKEPSYYIFYQVVRTPANTQQMTVEGLLILPLESLEYLRISQEASFPIFLLIFLPPPSFIYVWGGHL